MKKMTVLFIALLLIVACISIVSAEEDFPFFYGAFATEIEEPWDGVIHQALLKAQEEGKIRYEYTDAIGYSGDMERVLREVCEQSQPDMIVGDAFGNEQAVRRVAKDYPEIGFAFGSEYGPVEPNMSVFDNWIHEPAYLTGLIAGSMTETNVIGVVAAMPIPEVTRIVNAFIQGVTEYNPEAEVQVSYINSWFDPPTAKEAALAQIDAGADVLFAERFGVVEAAEENGLYAFGVMSDQNELAPEYVLTSVVWDMTPTIEYLITQVSAGLSVSQDLKDYSMMAKGGSSLADYHGNDSKIPVEALQLVETRQQEILDGMFRVVIDEADPTK
jgi:basic membrane lipoprotein Med (substrate-binding protein (PBP1-ABC) superfamily)